MQSLSDVVEMVKFGITPQKNVKPIFEAFHELNGNVTQTLPKFKWKCANIVANTVTQFERKQKHGT